MFSILAVTVLKEIALEDLRVILNVIFHKCMGCPKTFFHHCTYSTLENLEVKPIFSSVLHIFIYSKNSCCFAFHLNVIDQKKVTKRMIWLNVVFLE